MQLTSTFTFTLPITGNTGYANQSELTLELLDIGEIKLPYKEWDLTKIRKKVKALSSRLTLKIPSGVLQSTEIYEIEITEENIIFTFRGKWDGLYGGLKGGMSGYGNFTHDYYDKKAVVMYSIFCGENFWLHYLDWQRVVDTHTRMFGYEESRGCASAMYPIYKKLPHDRNREEVERWRLWCKDIADILALAPVEAE